MVRSPRFLALPGLIVAFTLLSGCWLDASTTRNNSGVVVADPMQVDQAVAIGITRLLNDPSTSVAILEDDVGLEWIVASGIVAHRQGHDALDGTKDDAPFRDLYDLLEVAYVDDVSIQRLGDTAMDRDLVPVRSVETVWFSAKEIKDTLDLVNQWDEDELHEYVGRRALTSILSARPFDTVSDLAEEPYIGPATLRDLRDTAAFLADVEAG